MDYETSFDWIGWLSTIPGIPAGWGDPPAVSAPMAVVSLTQPAKARIAEPLPDALAA